MTAVHHPPFKLFLSCPRYLEELLDSELQQLGLPLTRRRLGGVELETDLAGVYQVCLWSRLASRVLLQLLSSRVSSVDDVYRAVAAINWPETFAHSNDAQPVSFVVDFVGTSGAIRNSQYGAQLVKDAIVDRYSAGQRPSVDRQNPGLRINAHLARGRLSVALDLSGDSLHRRGYRGSGGAAPLKENLAAAIVQRSGWPALLNEAGQQPATVMLDPLCGSGTLLLEAAILASDTAPGLLRSRWGFEGWALHRPELWQTALLAASERHARGVETARQQNIRFFGFDRNAPLLEQARQSAARLDLAELFELLPAELAKLANPLADRPGHRGLLLTNPPYGERIGQDQDLSALYAGLGASLKNDFANWRAAVLSDDEALLDALRLRVDKQYRFRNGPLDCQLRTYGIAAQRPAGAGAKRVGEPTKVSAHADINDELANRLRKNRKRLRPAIKRYQSNCFRLYDADLPEFNSTVDCYADHVVITERAAPDTVDAARVAMRTRQTLATVAEVLACSSERLHYKKKQPQKGKTQYSRTGQGSERLSVNEAGARYLVNLRDYHDTGLFLDHRGVRRLIREMAAGKHFLNLFCYTAAATVSAALGGASASTSVDLSRPYLSWAADNLACNQLDQRRHELVQADCQQWLAECRQQFDLILLDPPSFSNSKRMETVLDIQRDHALLIRQCLALLSSQGTLVFSTNRRKFRLDQTLQDECTLQEVTERTLDADFQRPPPAHRCWLISK